MRKVYTSFILLLLMLFGAMSIAQEGQKRYINYQGVARNAEGNLMSSESLTIGVKLDFGSSGFSFEESHDLTTDANGVFSLLIGKGNLISGEYDNLPWGEFATQATVSINGNEIGTTELMAVPYALSSADNQWHTIGDDIENKNGGNVFVTGSLYASKDLSLAEGAVVNEFSTDITLSGNSDEIVPTQKAVKTYVDSQLGGSGGGADDQTADEVAYDNSISGLTATTAQDAIDELVTGGSIDSDSDPTNEIQDISLSGTELTISDGSTIDLGPIVPVGGTDDQNAGEVPYDNTTSGLTASDAQAAIDELASGGLIDTDNQDLSLSGTTLNISDGTGVDLAPIIPPGGTDDQNLILTGDVLSIENGSGSVDLSTYAGDDADADPTNEIDVTAENGLLIGDGSIITGLVGTIDGQVAKWDAGTNSWKAGTDATGGGGGSLWTDNGGDIYYNSGKVGVGTNTPESSIAIKTNGNQWNLTATEGDFRIGDASHRLKMGVAIDGAGAGDARIRVEGGTDRMMLGGGTNDVLTITDTNVGVGTITPAAKLHVDGNIKSNDLAGVGERNVVADASGNLIIGPGGGGSSLWSENGGDIYYDSGNVGVGTNSPDTHFEVSGTGTVRHRMTSTDAGTVSLQWMRTGAANTDWMFTAGIGRMEWGYSSSDLSGGTVHTRLLDDGTLDVVKGIRSGDLSGGGNVIADASGNLIIGAGGGGSSPWTENGSNIHFDAGNVGIGTSSPSVPLEINTSNARQLVLKSTTNDNYMQYITPAGFIGYSGVWSGNSDVDFGTTSGNTTGKVHLTTAATPKLTVAANGDVGIGTTGPSAKLMVKDNSTVNKPQLKIEETENDFARIELSSTANNALWHIAGIGEDGVSGAANSRLNFYFRNNQGAANRMTITGAGDVLVDGSLVHSSDMRLKKDIEDLPYGLRELLILEPKMYNWIDNRSEGSKSLGLIAQEVKKIIPEIVHEKTDSEKTLSLSYTELIPVIISAVQEQQKTIGQQSDKILDLEERIKKLETKMGN